LNDQSLVHSVEISYGIKCMAFTLLGALTVAGVQQGDVRSAVTFPSYGRANARVHPSAQEHHRFPALRIGCHLALL
jgi:hypothetical protein